MKKDQFLYDTVIDRPNLVVLAYNKRNILAYHEKSKKMHYLHYVCEDSNTDYSLLSHTPNEKWFEKQIKKLKLSIVAKETVNDYFEIIVL